jgi:hypothetical protein
MSTKLLWSGLTLVTVSGMLGWGSTFVLVGGIVMVIGCVLLWLDK